MELKYVILVLTVLAVVFIIVEEVVQSRSYSSLWNRPKSRVVLSKPFKHSKKGNYKILTSDEQALNIHPEKRWMLNVVNHETKEQKEARNIWSRQRWRDWTAKVQGNITVSETESSKSRKDKKIRKMMYRQKFGRFEVEDDIMNLSEDERLRISPYIFHEKEEKKRLSAPIIEKEVKYISYFLPWEIGQIKRHSFEDCRYNKCAFVLDMSQADLVAFAANHIRDHEIRTFQRPPGQRWLMYTVDPAIREFGLGRDGIRSLFNYTSTYRLDSDIPYMFGRLRKIATPPTKDYELIFKGKTHMIAWFVSHCETYSRREDYVKRMQTVVDVDIFGECGNMVCGGGSRGPNSRSLDSTVCLPLLSKSYKFYLAFENAFCIEYVTEKFFKLLQDVQVIPVVRGGFQYKKYLPSGIFVNADDFESPEELSQYLIDLGNDEQRYTDMLRRKDEWRVVKPPDRHCLLCEYLHSNPPSKFYPNLKKKFGTKSCYYRKVL